MRCPHCGAPTDVKDTRITQGNQVTRKRECFNGHKFKTTEQHDNIKREETHERGSRVGLRRVQEDGV
jgi:transcriptional regulator NrdR family protein